MIRRLSILCVVLATVLGLTACGRDAAAPEHQPAAEAGMRLDGDFGGSGPGTLLTASSQPTVDLRLRRITSVAARITYVSTSGVDGSTTKVSGTVFVPKGKPADGGWPVVAFGHGTTGVLSECAPSLSPTLLAASDVVSALIKAGYAVTMSDYQGLGLEGSYHPYLDATTEGYNLIDSVRAARKVSDQLSDRWVALGGSQGAQAAWAANELSKTYGGGLRMLGSVSSAVPADIDGFVAAAVAGDLTVEQKQSFVFMLYALKKERPQIDLDDYRRGVVEAKWDVLVSCAGPALEERAGVIDEMTADDLRPSNPGAVEVLGNHLRDSRLPKTEASAPMLVIYGGRDEFIPSVWTTTALDRACRLGDVVQIQLQSDKGHDDLDIGSAFDWIAGRFNGDPAPNDCESFLASRATPEEAQP